MTGNISGNITGNISKSGNKLVINDFAHFRFLARLQEFLLISFNKIFDKNILEIRKNENSARKTLKINKKHFAKI